MKPQLTEKRVLRKLLRKSFGQNQSYTNKYRLILNNFLISIKENWYIIILIVFFIIILIHLYLDNKKKKEDKEIEDFKQLLINKEHSTEQFKGSYESEYYKMLPRVTNSPNVIPYQY
jgi:cbb3-type cytochrome oxidase subunit 3